MQRPCPDIYAKCCILHKVSNVWRCNMASLEPLKGCLIHLVPRNYIVNVKLIQAGWVWRFQRALDSLLNDEQTNSIVVYLCEFRVSTAVTNHSTTMNDPNRISNVNHKIKQQIVTNASKKQVFDSWFPEIIIWFMCTLDLENIHFAWIWICHLLIY